MASILVVDDEPADRHLLKSVLEKQGHDVHTAATAGEALEEARASKPEVAVLDVMLPDESGLETFRRLREIDSRLPVIFVTASGSSQTAIEAMQLGAFDYLVKPLRVDAVKTLCERALEVRRMSHDPVQMDPTEDVPVAGDVMIGRSPAMQEVYKAIGRVASQNVTVLIRGESGTGKELVARALYQFSKRAEGPFLAVNCAAIPEPLLESELFGHEKGAFTGADRRRIGKFEQCHGGTLFLDEIGDMPPLLQSKLLRVLQAQTFERVGGNETIRTDVRVLAATNRNLEVMVERKEFREDLFYRLNGYTIDLPPLRERGDDLDLLVDHFRRMVNQDLEKDVQAFAPEAMQAMRDYSWPGNVRELHNAVRQAILKTTGSIVLPDFLPEYVTRGVGSTAALADEGELALEIDRRLRSESDQLYDQVIGWVEEQLVQRALAYTGGDKLRAIELLGTNPAAFRSAAALELLNLDAVAQGGDPVETLIQPGMTMEDIQREAIRRALTTTKGRRTDAAQMLGLSVRTLQRKIKEYDLDF